MSTFFLCAYTKACCPSDDQRPNNNLPELLEGESVGAVLHFMQRYHDKLTQIDSRKLEVKGQRSKLSEEVEVLQARVDGLNPNKKKATQEVK